MSMNQYTLQQLILQFAAYGLMVYVLPGLLFKKKLSRHPLAVRFLIYGLIGNFYLMNLVFLLQLLHICNPFTLWLVTILIIVAIALKNRNRKLLPVLEGWMEYWRRYLTGVIGRKTLWFKVGTFFKGILVGILKWMKRYVLPHLIEWVILVVFLVFMLYIRGTTYFNTYGYYASDLMVHNYWINALADGKLFVAGIYPYGYHCVLYSLHAMFGFKTVDLMRVFGLIQFTFLYLNVFAFLRTLGKTKFAPYLGLACLCGWNIWNHSTFGRYLSPLPQEYGVLFLFPALAFAILFFREKSVELKAAKLQKNEETEDHPEDVSVSKKKRRFLPVRRKKTPAGVPIMRMPRGTAPEKVFLEAEGLFFFCNREEFQNFLNKKPMEILPAEAYLEDGTIKPEYVIQAETEEEDPLYDALETEDVMSEESNALKAEDYPVPGSETSEDYPMSDSDTAEDYPVYFDDADDYPQYFTEDAKEAVPTAEVHPIDDDWETNGAAETEDYPAYYEEGEEPVYFEEDEDGYRYYYDENGDYPVIFEEEEETVSDDWDSLIKEALAPKQRPLTEDERARYERKKKWHASALYKLIKKTEPFRRKVKAWFDRRKLHPIRSFIAWCKALPPSGRSLFCFAMAFSMTLSCHFYVTIITGLGCIAIALCFFTQFFRWRYFKPVLIAVGFSFLFALYPMVIAYIGGTKLQGSLYWAVNVMKGDNKEEEDPDAEVSFANPNLQAIEINGITYYYMLGEGTDEDTYVDSLKKQAGMSEEEIREEREKIEQERLEEERLAAQVPLSEKLLEKKQTLDLSLDTYVVAEEGDFYGIPYYEVFYFLIAACFVLGLLCIFRDSYFGRAAASVALFSAFLLVLFITKDLGLPTIMDEDRARGFFGFVFPLVVGMAGDAVVFLILGFRKLRIVMHAASLALLAFGLYLVYDTKAFLTEPARTGALQTNGAMISTTRIINAFPNKHWTIVSANDELQMIVDYGWHTETITFLRGMEDYDATDSEMFIPTDDVFFYIEKIPLDYTEEYEDSGQRVSVAGAEEKLPTGNVKLEIYAGRPRWVIMSHMYYWAKQFMKLFPNEMEVFYEDDEFVCYRVRQDAYALYNFAIDYGYNAKSATADHRRRRSERE